MDKSDRKRIGVIGGLGALGAADIFFKLVKATPSPSGKEQYDIVFEQHPFKECDEPGEENANQTARKLYVFEMLRSFEERRVDIVMLPCFLSHTFIEELRAEVTLAIANIMDALRLHLQRRYPAARKLGVLTSNYVRKSRLFETCFTSPAHELVYPRPAVQNECLMRAIYGPQGIKRGHLQGESVELLERSCRDLLEQGAELIVPGFTEIPIVTDTLRERGLPIIDSNQIYAQHTVSHHGQTAEKAFKIGIVGGVGPAATVDFMNKIIRNAKASRDQEHIKIVVEQNPQIPDRTAHLVGAGTDPTIALYATCKKLEASDADLIAIPCNTAHAFVERIQPYLAIPIVNMLFETVAHIRQNHGDRRAIGLLATTGTVESRIYHDAFQDTGFRLVVPDAEHQAKVMNAIYGKKGVKAGFSTGECMEDILQALKHLVDNGAGVVILGCTELPLLLSQNDNFSIGGKCVALVDPTEILARKCVSASMTGRRTAHV